MKVLIYSHDSFGLGHLRRCRAIAHALVEQFSNLSVLILSGSPIIGSFNFKSRVDFVRIPGVIKLRNGDYTSLALHIDISETLALRESIIRHTAEIFQPDLFIVDKEPLGLRGEVKPTLEMLKNRKVPLVLGVRDVLDDPESLISEWQRKDPFPALESLYDEIWVYGLSQISNPFSGLELTDSVNDKTTYMGYLKREMGDPVKQEMPLQVWDQPFLLVTPGGGGDGAELVDLILSAYESQYKVEYPAVFVLGPFMPIEERRVFQERASKLGNVKMLTFETHIERMIEKAAAIVAMGGYNIFCEILSFDKPALLVPRKIPRLEQYIRAKRASELGLLSMLEEDEMLNMKIVVEKLNMVPKQLAPSNHKIPSLLSGLENICDQAEKWLNN